ncbi:type II toxin-antitoxin system Phd/YefM family antitoxin [Nesterenkonia ebinurensis]|uniref:type II toxin-antitoxin system Phd/YefM family antitoxin n=1 Tax=Nesterenkonia ebinurensis TaxID=2608252 RepID=UPI00123CB597|nr:type II toxin-antitoxin system Phd/YefM family antitoxin [Nesterenkonia ebinurensis]
MKTISIGRLRQNPVRAFEDVERGETLIVTRYHKEVGRIVPPGERKEGPTGSEVMEVLRSTPLEPGDDWAAELARDRAEDLGEDPWEQA